MSTDRDVSSGDREGLAEQAYVRLRDDIVSLVLAPGAPLSERTLSASLGLGLTPVREAIRRLALEKLAVIYPRRGTFVSAIDIGDEGRLTEIRLELEGFAAALAAERATDDERTHLLALVADLEAHGDSLALQNELDGRVHRAIYAAAHNDFLESTLTHYSNLALRIWNSGLQGQGASSVHHASQRLVVEAIARRDPAGARAGAEQHLRGFSEQVRSALHARTARTPSAFAARG